MSLTTAGWEVTLLATGQPPAQRNGITVLTIERPASRRRRMLKTSWALLRRAIALRADIYHIHDPELLPAALVLRALGRSVVYDVHEDLPRQVAGKPWIPPWLRPTISVLAAVSERIASRFLTGVVAATETIADRFPQSKTVLVRNYPRFPVEALGARASYSERERMAVYVGGITEIRGAREMVAAADRLADLGVRLVLAGDVSNGDLLDELASHAGVELIGWRSVEEVQALLRRAAVGLCVLHPLPNYLDSLPTKLFEYMAAGLPVIASDFPAWRKIVEDADCGLLVNPLDPTAIAAAIEFLICNPSEAAEMGRRGREVAYEQYRWDTEFSSLIKLYERIRARRV